MPRLVTIDAMHPDPAVIGDAAHILRSGGLVAFPTETVYGLGANALDRDAVRRIFAAKGRPATNPVIVHLASVADVAQVVAEWPATAARLAAAFWPGPLTLVLPRRAGVPDEVTAGQPTVAVRVPAHPVALALLHAAQVPVAAPSANRSTAVSPTTGAHVASSLGDAVDLILDAGPTDVGIESTVIDLTGDQAVLLRPGTIPLTAIEALVGPLGRPAARAEGSPYRAPGMMERHYAPAARVRLFAPHDLPAVEGEIARVTAEGARVGAVTRGGPAPRGATDVVRLLDDPDGYARGLYDALHTLEGAGCALIVIERVPDDDRWLGVRDRLTRAAANDKG